MPIWDRIGPRRKLLLAGRRRVMLDKSVLQGSNLTAVSSSCNANVPISRSRARHNSWQMPHLGNVRVNCQRARLIHRPATCCSEADLSSYLNAFLENAIMDTFAADNAWPIWDDEPFEGAFELSTDNGIDDAVVHSVERPWLFHYRPDAKSNGRGVLILGGGGYVELMVGREGVQVARWLASLGFDAFVLVHRFPNDKSTPQSPVDDARQALNVITNRGFSTQGLGICGLSSGGHLGASLLAVYPETWTSPEASANIPKIDFAIIGYGPISTNAKGRTIIPDKAALSPQEKQELYDVVQPDVQISTAPPTFIVYSGNDPVVPVVNAYRLAEGITKAGAAIELHIFADAPHGFALDTVGLPVSKWPNLCEAWLEQNGLLKT